MRANHDHGRGKEPGFAVKRRRADQQEIKRHGECGLGTQLPQSIVGADFSGASRQPHR